ncbi:MAG: sigma-70 family RNA polymerase sigma factor [Pseudomonadota bacterium]
MQTSPSDPITPGDASLEEAFAGVRARLRQFLARSLESAADVDDLLQDVFVKALQNARAGREIKNPSAWFKTVARTTLADHYRAKGLVPVEPVDDALAQMEDDDDLVHQELASCLSPLIDGLPTLYRDALRAVDLEQRAMRDVARAERVSVSAIKSRVARGRARLRTKLLNCCDVELDAGRVSDFSPRPGVADEQPRGCDVASCKA